MYPAEETNDMQNTKNKEKERRDHPPAILNYRKEEVKSRRSKKKVHYRKPKTMTN